MTLLEIYGVFSAYFKIDHIPERACFYALSLTLYAKGCVSHIKQLHRRQYLYDMKKAFIALVNKRVSALK